MKQDKVEKKLKLAVVKETLRVLPKEDLTKVGGGIYPVESENLTCNIECYYWSYFTK